MAKNTVNNVRLGLFVVAGLGFLILLLYMIGKNQNLFGKTFVLKARFENAEGLVAGNSVRFAGIDAGTVKSVHVFNDTTIEVTMLVKTKLKGFIHKNATATIGTDGLMGNKLIHIESGRAAAPLVEENDVLLGEGGVNTGAMLKVLDMTNRDVATIAAELKNTVQRINNSTSLWRILNEPAIPENIRVSLEQVRQATTRINDMAQDLQGLIAYVNAGKGTAGMLLKDSSIGTNLNEAITRIRQAGIQADSLTVQVSRVVAGIDQEIRGGKGPAGALLKDEEMVRRLNSSLLHIEEGAAGFHDNMEALKHSIFFRGYFRRLDKQKQKDPTVSLSAN